MIADRSEHFVGTHASRYRDCKSSPPGSNQSQIVALAKQAGISKYQVEDRLKDGRFNRHRGKGNELLYTLAEQRSPEIPAPIEEENREIKPSPAEVVA